jgi:hypothetical protein
MRELQMQTQPPVRKQSAAHDLMGIWASRTHLQDGLSARRPPVSPRKKVDRRHFGLANTSGSACCISSTAPTPQRSVANAGSETRQGLPSGHGEIGRSRRVRHVCTCGSGWTRIPKWGWKLPPTGRYPWNMLAERDVGLEASPRTAPNFVAPAKGKLGPPPWLSVSVGSGRLVCSASVISQLWHLTDMQQGLQWE